MVKASYGQACQERNEKLIGIQGQKSQLWVHSGMCGSLMADKASENVSKAPKSTALIPLPFHFPAHSLLRVTDFMKLGTEKVTPPRRVGSCRTLVLHNPGLGTGRRSGV